MSIDPQSVHRARVARRVDPHLVFGISLFVALGVSWPALSGAMHGRIDIVQAGIHLLVAVAIAWAGCYGVASLVYGYAQSMPAVLEPAAAPEGMPQRRAGDAVPGPLIAGVSDEENADAA